MAKCKYCKKEIRWILSAKGNYMACNPPAYEFWPLAGSKELFITSDGCKVTGTTEPVTGSYPIIGFMPHWLTCTAAHKAHNRKKA